MQQTLFTEDICSRNHGANPQSVAAEPSKESKEALRRRILQAIQEAGSWGISCDELAAKWNVGNHTLSPRFSELKANGMIRQIATRPTRSGKPAAIFVNVFQNK